MSDTVHDVDPTHQNRQESEVDIPAAQPTTTTGPAVGTLTRLLVGSALLGKKVGNEVEAQTPAGALKLKVVSVE